MRRRRARTNFAERSAPSNVSSITVFTFAATCETRHAGHVRVSQDDERTRTDYRDFSAEIDYIAETLPQEIERRCREFVHSYGLTFGALDLIFTPEGEYVFLENNPAGQFLFVEQLVPELRMLDAVTDCLIDGAHRTG